MSLQLAAQHLSHQGRGPDDQLVHMSSRELKSLNDLAMAHGGQLTINPHTGLPEAGFLDSLLPTLIGAGVSYLSGGTISPGMIGLGVGALESVRSGSLEKGLMAGLGAYGGAGITAGLSGVGEAALGMNARDAAIQSATEQGLQGEAYNKAIQEQVAQQMAEKATPFGNISAGTEELFKNPMQTLGNMGGEGGGLAGGWQTAKYAAGAAAPYLADAYKPTTDMPEPSKPTEYRQYKVRRRPDLSYEYTPLPVSTTFTPNFAEGGGISDVVGQYVDPNFKFKNVSGPPKVSTATSMPELKMAEGGRITPEEFQQMYMQQPQTNTRVQDLQYGARGYPDTAPTPVETPYERTQPTPPDITGTDGVTYTWDVVSGKYVAKPGTATVTPTTPTNTTPTPVGGGINANKEKTDAFFDSMTPDQLKEYMDKQADFINNLLTPTPIKILKDFLLYKPKSEAPAEVVNKDFNSEGEAQGTVTVGELSPAPAAPGGTAGVGGGDGGEATGTVTVGPMSPADGGDGGGDGGVGIGGDGGMGIGFGAPGPSSGNAGAMGLGPSGMAAGATSGGVSSGLSGLSGVGTSSGVGFGAPGATSGNAGAMGTGASGMAAGAGGGGGDGGGVGVGVGGGAGAGGGSGCCFIMLEARYGNGTMDSVVRRYRDEKMTDKNRRGYYKLAEVFVPLMRESKLFKFMVTKTFADPLVSYGKYHYGENKHGWLFKPVEKFWMKVFNTLGSDTKFIRENGEVV